MNSEYLLMNESSRITINNLYRVNDLQIMNDSFRHFNKASILNTLAVV